MTSSNAQVEPPINAGLNALLAAIDSQPYGLNGYLLAESQALKAGNLAEFQAAFEKHAHGRYIPISDEDEEPYRPYLLNSRAISIDPLKAGDPKRHRVFPVTKPDGILYTDRKNVVAGDYAQLAKLHFDTLILDFYNWCPEHLMPIIQRDARRISRRRGTAFQVTQDGHTMVLGSPGI